MTVCIFVGPTVTREDVQSRLDAICLPPVAQGDLFRAARHYKPRAIGIIDGFFGGAPAVWHKEILWAMSQGIAVYGSASMGALRAAELHGFGMRGVGRIFEAYRDGVLEDDDEVAVTHGPAELGFMSLSEPMVNIREALSKAEAAGVLDATSRNGLEAFAKSLYFPERSWPSILEGGRERSFDPDMLASFGAWLGSYRVDLKRDDALAMLDSMQNMDASPASAPFHFERTYYWSDLISRPDEPPGIQDSSAADDAVLDEFRLRSRTAFEATRTKALLRFACDVATVQQQTARDAIASDHPKMVATLREALGLFSRNQFEAWLARNNLDAAAFEKLAESSTRLEALADAAQPLLSKYLLHELRLSGDYARLAARAGRKQAGLAAEPSRHAAELTPSQRLELRLWFVRRIDQTDDVEIGEILKNFGFNDAEHLDRTLYRERLYLTLIAPACDD